MTHDLGPKRGDAALDVPSVGEITQEKLRGGVHELPAPAREIVEHKDLGAQAQETIDDVRADETGSSGHENAHGTSTGGTNGRGFRDRTLDRPQPPRKRGGRPWRVARRAQAARRRPDSTLRAAASLVAMARV